MNSNILMSIIFNSGNIKPKDIFNGIEHNSEILKVYKIFLKNLVVNSNLKLINISFKNIQNNKTQKIIEQIIFNDEFQKNKKKFLFKKINSSYFYWNIEVNNRSLSKFGIIGILTN